MKYLTLFELYSQYGDRVLGVFLKAPVPYADIRTHFRIRRVFIKV